MIFLLSEITVIISVEPAEFFVTEPDDRENISVSFCLVAQLNETLKRNASFYLNFSTALSSADVGSDFYALFFSPIITIPTNFSGKFEKCFSIIIIGDNFTEHNEIIVFQIGANSPFDLVESTQVEIHILNDDGE